MSLGRGPQATQARPVQTRTFVYCDGSIARALQQSFGTMQNSTLENAIFPLGAFWGHCIHQAGAPM